jgi:hypothetical protein
MTKLGKENSQMNKNRQLLTVSWAYRYLDFIAMLAIVFKIFIVSAGYITNASYGNGLDIKVWTGLVLLGTVPYVLVFGVVKHFLRREVQRLVSLSEASLLHSGFVDDGIHTSASLNITGSGTSHWLTLFNLSYFIMATFYVGIRYFFAAELSGIDTIYLVDAFMVISFVTIMYLGQKRVARLT